MRTRVNICCIASEDEARTAVAAGAYAVGLVGDMPSGPGVIDDDLARMIAASVPPGVSTFLLTQRTRATEIAAHAAHCGASAVQIVNPIDPAEYPRLVDLLPPAVRRVQVVHVEGGDALNMTDAYAPFVHGFLLDSGRPSAAVPELGGTGRVHDWEVSARFVERSPKPVFLAGGLNADNVGRAIERVRPYGLDVCSGVRVDDRLSATKLARFMAAVGVSPGP